MQLLEDIPEYMDMRKALMALRLEVPPDIADDILSHCEKAALAIKSAAWQAGYADGVDITEFV